MNSLIRIVIILCIFSPLTAAGSNGPPDNEVTFAVISDVRADALDSVLEFITTQHVDFILLPGDFYYHKQAYYPHFRQFGFEARPEIPPDQQNLYIALGNHDATPTGDSTFTNLIAPCYPKNGPASSPEGTVFSFDRGNCHFVVTNPYWGYPEGGYSKAQLDWIESDLAVSDQPFKFVAGHEPAFPLDRHIGDSLDLDTGMRDRFWEILSEQKVQVYFCGHSHHLSHLENNGVYQIDAGQVANPQQDITIVTVNDQDALITSYETTDAGTLMVRSPSSGTSGSRFQTIAAQSADAASDESRILHEGMPAQDPGGSGGCFVSELINSYQRLFN